MADNGLIVQGRELCALRRCRKTETLAERSQAQPTREQEALSSSPRTNKPPRHVT